MFVISWSVRPFQPKIMSVGEPRAYHRGGGHQKCAPLTKALAIFVNIRPGWKGLPGTNTLAYYKK